MNKYRVHYSGYVYVEAEDEKKLSRNSMMTMISFTMNTRSQKSMKSKNSLSASKNFRHGLGGSAFDPKRIFAAGV
ncbi:MAG: hypothetical protein J6C96_11765 [Oscillospiraceae bacterium]|nr:hypothetical protein [Oscillospiraceae bacterium]